MSTVRLLADNESERWDAFVESHEEGSIYHTSTWRDIIREVYGHQPVYLVVENAAGHITAGLPAFSIRSGIAGNRISSTPGAHFCNPLVGGQEDFTLLIDGVRNLMKQTGTDYFELKTSHHFTVESSLLAKAESDYSSYLLDLARPLDTIMGNFHKSCIQRVLKNIDKSGLRLRRAESVDDIKPFYHLYLGMRKRYGLLPQPYRFFASMWQALSRRNRIEVYLADYRGKIVSAAIFLLYRDTVMYDYGASDFDMMRLHPSHFVLWAAIMDAHERGYRRFDFGRTSDDNTGLSEFKSRWGATRETLNYYYMPEIAGFAAMRRKSLPKKIMNWVVRLSPAAACRLMGRVLYRNYV